MTAGDDSYIPVAVIRYQLSVNRGVGVGVRFEAMNNFNPLNTMMNEDRASING